MTGNEGEIEESRTGRGTRSEATRERILEAVLALIARGGPAAVTYRALAAESGAPLGVLTYHFSNRTALIRAAYELHLERTRERGRAIQAAAVGFASAATTDRAVIVDAIVGLASGRDAAERERQIADFELMLETARDPALEAELAEARDLTTAMARELVAKSGSSAPEEDTWILIGALGGLALESLARPAGSELEQRMPRIVARLLDLVFDGETDAAAS